MRDLMLETGFRTASESLNMAVNIPPLPRRCLVYGGGWENINRHTISIWLMNGAVKVNS